MDAVLPAVVEVRVNIFVVSGDERVAAVKNLLNRPAVFHRSPLLLRVFVADVYSLAVVGEGDPWITADCVIPIEVQPEECRNRLFGVSGETDQNVDLRVRVRGVEPNTDLLKNRFAVQCGRVDTESFPTEFFAVAARHDAVHLRAEKAENFAAPFFGPDFRRCDRSAVFADERVGKGIGDDLRLVEIFVPLFGKSLHEHKREEEEGEERKQVIHCGNPPLKSEERGLSKRGAVYRAPFGRKS